MASRPALVRTCVRMYVELHCHSAFSFLDGASLPDELAPAALELGHQALALTDHNTVSGSMEFAVAARALGLRPIHGAEVDLLDGRHLTLLVQDARGHEYRRPIASMSTYLDAMDRVSIQPALENAARSSSRRWGRR